MKERDVGGRREERKRIKEGRKETVGVREEEGRGER